MKIKTYIINLKESIDRRERILKEIALFPFLDAELMDAVYGKLLSKEEIDESFDCEQFYRKHKWYPVPAEIGCTLSHRKCYKALLESNEPYMLVLEDDATFVRPEDTERLLKEGVQLLESGGTEIVFFVPNMCPYPTSKPLFGEYKVYDLYNGYGTIMYLISRKGAQLLQQAPRAGVLADDLKWMQKKGLRIKNIHPSIVLSTNVINSTIGQEKKLRAPRTFSLFFKGKLFLQSIYERYFLRVKWIEDQPAEM